MSIQEARRAAFEKWFADQKKHNDLLLDRISIDCVWAGAPPETLGAYQHQAQDAWNAWNAALDSVVVELPESHGGDHQLGIEDCVEAIEAAGIRVEVRS